MASAALARYPLRCPAAGLSSGCAPSTPLALQACLLWQTVLPVMITQLSLHLACTQVRLCFGRKNKTLGGIFRQHATLALLQSNRDTQAALRQATSQQGSEPPAAAALGLDDAMDADTAREAAPEADADDEAADMELDAAVPVGQGRKGKHRYTEALKHHVLGVLQQGDFETLRSGKLAQEDFLRLLAAFNKADIHFA